MWVQIGDAGYGQVDFPALWRTPENQPVLAIRQCLHPVDPKGTKAITGKRVIFYVAAARYRF
jgi:hypothetical protein